MEPKKEKQGQAWLRKPLVQGAVGLLLLLLVVKGLGYYYDTQAPKPRLNYTPEQEADSLSGSQDSISRE